MKFSGDSGNEFIAQLWALRRVGFLLDEIRLRGDNKELRDEVVDLARRFAIVTPYTSYLIVEDEARRGVPLTSRSLQTLTPGSAALKQLGDGYANLSKKDGYDGAWNARSNSYFKFAEQAAGAQNQARQESKNAIAANGLSATGAAAAPTDAAYAGRMKQLDQADQQTRWVNGKSFAQNGQAWTDTDLQAQQKAAKRNRVQFGSKDYFALLDQEPDSAQWLALGNSVTFALKDQVYEIYE
jgi:Ca-activated chloride channel homolog